MRISTKIENRKKKPRETLEQKNTLTELKISLEWFIISPQQSEERFVKLEDKSCEAEQEIKRRT